MADPSVEMISSGRFLVARVSGDIDADTDPVLRPRFKQLIMQGRRFIVLDLSHVSSCDAAGLALLMRTWRQADTVGAVLALACVPERLWRIFQRTGAEQVLRVYDTIAEAEAALDD
ncbi:STAS domain-containing protein [Streptomyces sp. HUAS TT7]|uniref:STAS domain-containing protein n=1 Tax=Streptomyces sp. HUAS TT7 TaxID=3447507 RepID=UPI003F654FD5